MVAITPAITSVTELRFWVIVIVDYVRNLFGKRSDRGFPPPSCPMITLSTVTPAVGLGMRIFSAFSIAVPRLWNALPGSITDCKSDGPFKTSFKAHLFNICF